MNKNYEVKYTDPQGKIRVEIKEASTPHKAIIQVGKVRIIHWCILTTEKPKKEVRPMPQVKRKRKEVKI
jgi:hypothetical protein